MLLFPSFILAMFVSMMLIPILIKLAPIVGLVDIPDERKVHQNTIPRIGGVAMVIASVIPMFLWLPFEQEYYSYLIGVIIIFVFGVLDDKNDLDYRIKFAGQFLAIFVIIYWGGFQIKYLPFMEFDPIPEWISIPLTVFAVLGITNAINLVDGLDGLAGGTNLIGFGVICLLSYLPIHFDVGGNPYVAMISLSIMGSILGFLRFNTHPARIFMGDTGSQFLGISIAVLSIKVTQQPDLPYSSALPLILLGWPIFDTLMVMTIRISQGRSPFSPDKNHIHHKLLSFGVGHYHAVFIIYLVQAILAILAFSLRSFSDSYVIGVYILINLVTIALMILISKKPMQEKKSNHNSLQTEDRGIINKFLKGSKRKTAENFLSVLVCLLCVAFFAYSLVVFLSSTDKAELENIVLLSVVMVVVLIINGLVFWKQQINWLERAGLYLLSALMVYLTRLLPETLQFLGPAMNMFFMILAISVVIGFRLSRGNSLEITTLDFLVIFAVIIVNVIPGIPKDYSVMGIRLVLFFYAIEFIICTFEKRANLLRASAAFLYSLVILSSLI